MWCMYWVDLCILYSRIWLFYMRVLAYCLLPVELLYFLCAFLCMHWFLVLLVLCIVDIYVCSFLLGFRLLCMDFCGSFWSDSVGYLLNIIMLFSCINVSNFCLNTSLSIITIALVLSALVTRLLRCGIFFICLYYIDVFCALCCVYWMP